MNDQERPIDYGTAFEACRHAFRIAVANNDKDGVSLASAMAQKLAGEPNQSDISAVFITANNYACAYAPEGQWEVMTRMGSGDDMAENTFTIDDEKTVFSSKREALAEVWELVEDTAEAVREGNMSEGYAPTDYFLKNTLTGETEEIVKLVKIPKKVDKIFGNETPKPIKP